MGGCTFFSCSMGKEKVLSHVRLLRPCGLCSARILCPSDSPGKNTGVGCHFLLQGIFHPGIKPWSSALQADSLPAELQGSPRGKEVRSKEQSLGEFLKNALCEGMQQEIVRFQVHFVGKLQSRHTLAFKTSWVILAAAASHCRAARSEGFLWFCDSQPAGSTGRGAGHK